MLLGISPMALAGKPTRHQTPKKSSQQFKNIKVLKDLPADQMIPVMRKINASLGVKCDFCHVINPDHTGFEKDDKRMKAMARKMMVMTQKLNKSEKILEGKATCFMCHHGRPEPDTNAPTPPPPGR
jgi:hypothetical protein